MDTIVRLAFALVPLLLASEESRPTDSAQATTVSGTILEEATNQPLSGASVRLLVDGRQVMRTETDEAGEFRFETEVRAGAAELEVWAEGFLPSGQRFRIACEQGGARQPPCSRTMDLYLDSAGGLFRPSASTCRLEGTVSSTDGRPGVGARVALEGRFAVTESEGEGRFSLEGVRSGLHVASVTSLGMHVQERLILVSCDAEGGTSLANFRMLPQVLRLGTIMTGSRDG
jgi:hypothetical protein